MAVKVIAQAQLEAGEGEGIFTARRSVLGWPERAVKRVAVELESGRVELERSGYLNFSGSSWAVYGKQDEKIRVLVWWKGEK